MNVPILILSALSLAQSFPRTHKSLSGRGGALHETRNTDHLVFHHDETPVIPDHFDARNQWPDCESIREIRDQGECGSCWAFAAASVMSDRLCIATDGQKKKTFSPEYLLSCCADCGNCNGGYIQRALEFWTIEGVVSGGDYNSDTGCLPYDEDAYLHQISPTCQPRQCSNKYFPKSFIDDIEFGYTYYHIKNNVTQIQTEILKNGPVIATYVIYGSFMFYENGIYEHNEYEYEQYVHAVKIVGWGSEKEKPYWLVANSWGEDWADLSGFFKIARGVNECDIESNIWTAKARP